MKEFKAYESEKISYYGFYFMILNCNNKFYTGIGEFNSGYIWTEIDEDYFNQTLNCKALKMRKIENYKYEKIKQSIKE